MSLWTAQQGDINMSHSTRINTRVALPLNVQWREAPEPPKTVEWTTQCINDVRRSIW